VCRGDDMFHIVGAAPLPDHVLLHGHAQGVVDYYSLNHELALDRRTPDRHSIGNSTDVCQLVIIHTMPDIHPRLKPRGFPVLSL
jgi:hypothetical protein